MSKEAEKAAEKAAKEKAAADAKAAKEAEKAAEKAAKASADGEPITVKFRDHRGEPTERTFSLDVHGEAYAELAEQFKTKHANRLIK